MDNPPPQEQSIRRSVLTEIAIPAETLTPSRRESFGNLSADYISPTSSPDEFIIQKRGPRKIPLTWSPVNIEKLTQTPKITTQSDESPHKTPPKIYRRSVRKLRLSPKKTESTNLKLEQIASRNLFNDFDNNTF